MVLVFQQILLLATIGYVLVVGGESSPHLQINTTSLGLVQGEISSLASNVRQFIGIPFAQPPVGSLRFKPPVAPVKNTSALTIYNATAAAHLGGFPLLDCIRFSDGKSNVLVGQEDCLYLDVYLPLNTSNVTLLPVVIYIYGGGFQKSDPHDPTELVSFYQNIIYVTIRYRLNIFGFIASTSLSASRAGPIHSSGLQGFEDQQMAINWVRNNIQAFGGNPNLITLQGHSSGAISICLHLVAPASQGLFQRAIIESGGCDIEQATLSQMEIIGDLVTVYFCNRSSDALACLQAVNASTLMEYALSKNYLNYFTTNSFHPLIDGLILPDSITNLFEQNKFSTNVSLLTGTTSSEFGLFIAGQFEPGWQVTNLTKAVLDEWLNLYSQGQSPYLNAMYNSYGASFLPASLVNYYALTDALSTAIFQCPVRRTAAYLANNGSRAVYLYSFNYIPLSSPFAQLSQAVHGQEAPFVFKTANLSSSTQSIFPVSTFNADEQVLALAMSLLWIRFAVHGNPNTPLTTEQSNPLITQLSALGGWPMYTGNTTANLSSYVVFSNAGTGNSSATIQLSASGYHQPTCAAWDEILPKVTIVPRCNTGYSGYLCSVSGTGHQVHITVSSLVVSLLFIITYEINSF